MSQASQMVRLLTADVLRLKKRVADLESEKDVAAEDSMRRSDELLEDAGGQRGVVRCAMKSIEEHLSIRDLPGDRRRIAELEEVRMWLTALEIRVFGPL